MIKCGVFDLDGVILDSWPVMAQAFEAAFRSCKGVGKPPVGQFRSRMGKPLGIIAAEMRLPTGFEASYIEVSRSLAAQNRLFPGVRPTLDRLKRKGFRLALNTGKDRERTLELLDAFGLASDFEIVISGDDVACGKPAPDSLLAVARLTGVACGEMIFVGDSGADMHCAECSWRHRDLGVWGAGDPVDLRQHAPRFEAETIRAIPGLCLAINQRERSYSNTLALCGVTQPTALTNREKDMYNGPR